MRLHSLQERLRTAVLLFFSFLYSAQLLAQEYHVSEVHFNGLRKTKASTLQKIIGLYQGDLLSSKDTSSVFDTYKRDLYNTKLFTSVTLTTKVSGDSIALNFKCVERWYTYLRPHFELIDRNFNEWWVVRNRDLERIIAGTDITQKNLTGRNDDLSVALLTGFQQKAEVRYLLPYHFWNGKLGLEARGIFHRYRSVNYTTLLDQLQFMAFNRPQLQRWESSLELQYFPVYNEKRWLRLGYHDEKLEDALLAVAPDYLGNEKERLQYGFLSLGWQSDHRDVRGYASRGTLLHVELSAYTFLNDPDLNFIEFRSRFVAHQPITKKWNLATSVGVKWSPDKRRPYFLNRALGWDVNRIRNYDYFATEGPSYIFEKLSLRYMAFNRILHNKWPIRQFQKIPLKVVPKAYFDMGYVPTSIFVSGPNNLPGQAHWAYGLGIDFVLYDDAVWRFEVGTNREGQAAFFLNFTSAIQ